MRSALSARAGKPRQNDLNPSYFHLVSRLVLLTASFAKVGVKLCREQRIRQISEKPFQDARYIVFAELLSRELNNPCVFSELS